MLDETVEKKTAASSSQETLLGRDKAQSLVGKKFSSSLAEKNSQATLLGR